MVTAGLGLFVLCSSHVAAMYVVAGLLCVAAHHAVNDSLSAFPWIPAVDKYGQRNSARFGHLVRKHRELDIPKEVGWPFLCTARLETAGSPHRKKYSVLSLLVAWWSFALLYRFWSGYLAGTPEIADILFVLFVLSAVFVNYASAAGAYQPPMDLAGRIRTGNLVIPRYDKVFLSPLFIGVIGVAMALTVHWAKMPHYLTLPPCIFVLTLLTCLLGPTHSEWTLTGGYSIMKH